LTAPRDLEAQVCEGQSVFGFERAGDLLAVLRVVWRRADLAGPTVFVGESHGGWTVSDFYALAGGGLVPPNIAGGVAAPKDRLGPAFLFYPYCGFGSLDGDAGWPPGVKLTVFLGGKDTNTDLVPCRQRIARLKSRGAAVNEVVFPDATHWFDNDRDFDLLPHRFDESATRDAGQHIDAVLAGR
jgi:dienelactone hydrolase